MRTLDPALSRYFDRKFPGTEEQYHEALRVSTTVYVGNLSFYTTEEQIYELFALAGDVHRVHMGLDRNTKTPCGFCFVVYHTREDAEACVRLLSGAVLDDRPLRADFDWGFVEGRQWGRGRSGGQVRDEWREDYDQGRGGYGRQMVSPQGGGPDPKRRRMSGDGGFGRYGGGGPPPQPQVEDDRRMRTGDRGGDDE